MEFGERFHTKEAKDEKVRKWQRPREKAAAVRAREEGARVQVLSSFAKPDKTNEQTKVRVALPPEVPHDARICIEDLLDIDESKDNEKKGKQPGNGTQEPKKKTARDVNPRTRGDS